jgi:hypothetical protein
MRSLVVLAVVLAAAVALTACGGGGSDDASKPAVVHAGQVDIQLPPGWKVTKNGAIRPADDASTPDAAANPGAGDNGDAVPLAKEDPTTKFFKAISTFSGCLRDLNVKFIGVPDGKDPSAPVNNPDYIQALSKCAAKSNILQALKDEQAAQDALTPQQIEDQNKAFLKWRDCMIGRGWGIPKPKPDAKGRLFSFGAGNASAVPQFTPPPGQDLITSSDTTECAQQVQRETAGG